LLELHFCYTFLFCAMVLASARLRGIHLTLIVLKMADVHGGGGGGGGGGCLSNAHWLGLCVFILCWHGPAGYEVGTAHRNNRYLSFIWQHYK
jgi:hypothetical protein